MEKIKEICDKYEIKNYNINPDGSIDVNGSVNLNGFGLTELPLTFNDIIGSFECDYNQLTTLKGCPVKVGGYFACVGNKLTNLKFAPKKIGIFLDCRDNNLETNYYDSELESGVIFSTSLKESGLIENEHGDVINYPEWCKSYKRKSILKKLNIKNR